MIPLQLNRWKTVTWKSTMPRANRYRFYEITLRQNIWGEWEIQRAWGRLNSARTLCQNTLVPGIEEGEKLLSRESKRRAKRGYVLLSPNLI